LKYHPKWSLHPILEVLPKMGWSWDVPQFQDHCPNICKLNLHMGWAQNRIPASVSLNLGWAENQIPNFCALNLRLKLNLRWFQSLATLNRALPFHQFALLIGQKDGLRRMNGQTQLASHWILSRSQGDEWCWLGWQLQPRVDSWERPWRKKLGGRGWRRGGGGWLGISQVDLWGSQQIEKCL
jgi:hypothetical protein